MKFKPKLSKYRSTNAHMYSIDGVLLMNQYSNTVIGIKLLVSNFLKLRDI